MRVTGALSPHLDPRGFKDYTLDEPTSDDNEDMFFSDSDPSNSGLTGGSAFAMDGRWGVIIRVDIRSSNYWRWLRFWRRPGGVWRGGVSFARPHAFLVVITGRSMRGCFDVGFFAGCWSQD